MQDLVRAMENGTRPGGLARRKPVAPKSIRNYVGTLSALFNFAQRKPWAHDNPCRYVDLPPNPASEEIRSSGPTRS